MDPEEQIRQLLLNGNPENPGTWGVLFDMLEENPDLLDSTVEFLVHVTSDQQGEEVSIAPRDVWARLLGELAKADYATAVTRLNQVKLASRDYRSHSLLVDAINTPHCGGGPVRHSIRHSTEKKDPTWQEKLEHEKMEQVTGETGGDLGSWEVIDADGKETQRRWTIDFIPDWMERNFQAENEGFYPEFKTVWYDDGGNFGPGFDETLRDKDGLWRSLFQFSAGTEPECPWISGDDGDLVTLEHTYCGENPGKECALCGGALGEEHGVIYLGELGAAIFGLDVMDAVRVIEIVERKGGNWDVIGFDASNNEIELAQGLRYGFDTLAMAMGVVMDRVHRGVEIVTVPLE